jgi:CRISPR system Cascade subunit CasE
MSETWCQSRVTLRPDRARAVLALAPDLFAGGPEAAAHRLIWTLFGDKAERQRDFLFRVVADRPLQAIVRSARPPVDQLDLWTIDQRPFTPRITQGQPLRFRVSAVPTVQISRPGRARSQRRSVVMDLPAGLDAEQRREHVEEAALAWLHAQGERHGFMIVQAGVVDIRRIGVGREGARSIVLGTAEFEGRLAVTEPDAFVLLLREGLGPNRSFGYGLVEVAPDRTGPAPAV